MGELEKACFDDAWPLLAPSEALWAWEALAFARWNIIRLAQEAELLRIAVLLERRGRGWAQKLLKESCEALVHQGIQRIFLEVRVSNLPAIGLYEAMGWKRYGVRSAYYRNGEDALLFQGFLNP